MGDERRIKVVNAPGALGGIVWFIGWLFTIGFVHLTGWKILFGLFIRPYYLGVALR